MIKISYIILVFGSFVGIGSLATAADPAWWIGQGAKSNLPASNKAIATSGQAKWLLKCMLAELQIRLPAANYNTFQAEMMKYVDLAPPVDQEDFERQRSVLLVGQLKAIAKPIYDQLRALNPSWLDGEMANFATQVTEPGSSPPAVSPYPWSQGAGDDSNYSPATLGQLKAVFSLRIENLTLSEGAPSVVDSDRDGLDDSYEITHFGNLGAQAGDGDADNDGIKNRFEQQCSSDPLSDQSQTSGASVTLAYDSEGRMLSKTGPTTSSVSYDEEGNILSTQATP